jgi:hypothetical protein
MNDFSFIIQFNVYHGITSKLSITFRIVKVFSGRSKMFAPRNMFIYHNFHYSISISIQDSNSHVGSIWCPREINQKGVSDFAHIFEKEIIHDNKKANLMAF